MRCELISWQEVQRLCLALARQIRSSGLRPQIVVAIARGGLIPARLICDVLDIQTLGSMQIQHYLAGADKQAQAILSAPLCIDIEDQRVLLIDDVNDSGDTLELAADYLQSLGPEHLSIAVMHQKTSSDYPVDFYAKKIVKWRWLIYPWAVYEDLSGLLRRWTPVPQTPEEAQRYLAETYGIEISLRRIAGVLEFMDQPEESTP